MRLTIHLYLMLRLVSRAIPPLPTTCLYGMHRNNFAFTFTDIVAGSIPDGVIGIFH